ncbi:hypothetical protein CEXT_229801 [Caerostris extrusa]|uniref:Uncharacterized protein n=1 Tax=Caerostris extrusa TaxID=172846 RepID=A0AAV4MRC5_CAEEX|nr:hypothetical protein CEXT_229801 [Caerostris extrusa]
MKSRNTSLSKGNPKNRCKTVSVSLETECPFDPILHLQLGTRAIGSPIEKPLEDSLDVFRKPNDTSLINHLLD